MGSTFTLTATPMVSGAVAATVPNETVSDLSAGARVTVLLPPGPAAAMAPEASSMLEPTEVTETDVTEKSVPAVAPKKST